MAAFKKLYNFDHFNFLEPFKTAQGAIVLSGAVVGKHWIIAISVLWRRCTFEAVLNEIKFHRELICQKISS